MRIVPLVKSFLCLALLAFTGLLGWGWARHHPQDLPWTRLDLASPVGMFTGRKLVELTQDAPRCGALLTKAGVRFRPLPAVNAGRCGYADGVRFADGGSRRIGYLPADLGTSCAVAAGLTLWEWHVVQPAAQRHFGSAVTRIDHYGSYSCRRVNGREGGAFSEHATADAVDIAAFRLADGRRVDIVGDWNSPGIEAKFLREVRDGACDLFATVLSPDYNDAHRDHLHFDQAQRGARGWRGCR